MLRRKFLLFLAFVLALTLVLTQALAADRERARRRDRNCFPPVTDKAYVETCGACHFAYQPGLLPSGSWKKLLDGTEKHFDASFELDPAIKKELAAYLEANAAEKSTNRRSARIMKSVGKTTPLRITDIQYIRDKHHEITPDDLKHPTLNGSLSNCAACHQKAVEGDYNDRYVTIPK